MVKRRDEAEDGLSFEDEAAAIEAELEAEELSPKGIADNNRFLIERQRRYRRAADLVAEAWRAHDEVSRVALIGSVAMPLWKEVPRFRSYRRASIALWHECKDLDLAVWLDRLDRLNDLRRAANRTLPRIFAETRSGVAPHELDVFLFEAGSDRYLGRLCGFKQCPARKPDCRAPGCGMTPFLKQIRDFRLHADIVAPERAVVLFDRQSGAVRSAVDLPGPREER